MTSLFEGYGIGTDVSSGADQAAPPAPHQPTPKEQTGSFMWGSTSGLGDLYPQTTLFTGSDPYKQAMAEAIGFDPGGYNTLQNQLTGLTIQQTQAAQANQARQQGMLGTAGAGANVTANNALVTGMGGQLLGQQAQLGQANLQQMEQDEAELYDRAQRGLLTDMEQQQFQQDQQTKLYEVGSEMLANLQNIKGGLDSNDYVIYSSVMQTAGYYLSAGDPNRAYAEIYEGLGMMGLNDAEAQQVAGQFIMSFSTGTLGKEPGPSGGWNMDPTGTAGVWDPTKPGTPVGVPSSYNTGYQAPQSAFF